MIEQSTHGAGPAEREHLGLGNRREQRLRAMQTNLPDHRSRVQNPPAAEPG